MVKYATVKRDPSAKCEIVTTLLVIVDDSIVFVGALGRFFSPRLKQFLMTRWEIGGKILRVGEFLGEFLPSTRCSICGSQRLIENSEMGEKIWIQMMLVKETRYGGFTRRWRNT